jgi:hypothetical protein
MARCLRRSVIVLFDLPFPACPVLRLGILLDVGNFNVRVTIKI